MRPDSRFTHSLENTKEVLSGFFLDIVRLKLEIGCHARAFSVGSANFFVLGYENRTKRENTLCDEYLTRSVCLMFIRVRTSSSLL